MILLDIGSPISTPPVLLGLFLMLFIPLLISIMIFKQLKEKKNKGIKFQIFVFGLLFILFGILFVILDYILISRYGIYYDYLTRLFFQVIIALFIFILISILIYFGLLIYKKEKDTKILNLSLILFIALLIVSPFCFNFIPVKEKPTEYTYLLDIKTDSNNIFTLYFPTFYDNNETLPILTNDDISGNCTFQHIINNGTFIKINCRGPLLINYHSFTTKSYRWSGHYLGHNNTNDWNHQFEYLIYYFSESNSSINIIHNWEFHNIGSETSIYLDGVISSNGWQSISGDVQAVKSA